MAIDTGGRLPSAQLLRIGAEGPETVDLDAYVAGRKVVVFAFAGAYTGVCATSHIPSFIRTAEEFAEKGVDEIIGIAVNDPFVLKAFGESTGATEAGITLLGDPTAEMTKALGLEFTAPPIGLIDRSNRYAVVLEDGVITVANVDAPATCDLSTGEKLLEAM